MQTEAPANKRSRFTDKLELRKLWHVPKAEFIYALFTEVETETCELEEETVTENGKEVVKQVPNWDKIVASEKNFQNPQGYIGDADWAKRTAEHFNIEFPEEEYKG